MLADVRRHAVQALRGYGHEWGGSLGGGMGGHPQGSAGGSGKPGWFPGGYGNPGLGGARAGLLLCAALCCFTG